jgi:hypothetical protein
VVEVDQVADQAAVVKKPLVVRVLVPVGGLVALMVVEVVQALEVSVVVDQVVAVLYALSGRVTPEHSHQLV